MSCRKFAIAAAVTKRRKTALALALHLSVGNQVEKNRQKWRKPWIDKHDEQGVFQNLVKELEMGDEVSFRNYFRMSPTSFRDLVTKVAPLIQRHDSNFHKCVPPDERLGVTLRFLATGETFKSLSYSFRLGASTIGEIVGDTCQAIYCALKDDYLKVPNTEEEWVNISRNFQERWNFPNTIGAIDGKHIALQAPPHSGSVFYNYKHFYSIVLLAVVDADYRFLYVDVGCNGRISDGGVFAACNLRDALDYNLVNIPESAQLPGEETMMSFHLLGDEAFPLKDYLMKPFPFRNMTENQRIYNYRLSRARRVVENAFGIMAAKFRVFLGKITLSLEKAESVVLAACALHNYLRTKNDAAYIGHGSLDEEDERHQIIPGSWRSDHSNMKQVAIVHSNFAGCAPKEKRLKLMDYLCSQSGSVPWQDHMI